MDKQEPCTREEFGKRLRAKQSSPHELRKMLEAMPRLERARALLAIFTDYDANGRRDLGAQKLAGKLLLQLQPKCAEDRAEVLRSVLPTWNLSASELPFYLAYTFGKDQVLATVERLQSEYLPRSVERSSLDTIAWWLTGAVTFFPATGTRRLSLDLALEKLEKGGR